MGSFAAPQMAAKKILQIAAMSTELTDLIRLKREVKRAQTLLEGLQTMLRHVEEAQVRVAKKRPAVPRIQEINGRNL
jgi:hypothetical protein